MASDEERDQDGGGYDPDAFERRRAQAALDQRPLQVNGIEPEPIKEWRERQWAEGRARHAVKLKELGPKPRKANATTIAGKQGRFELARWMRKWWELRLQLDQEVTAKLQFAPFGLLELPDGEFHLEKNWRIGLGQVETSKKQLAEAQALEAERRADLQFANADRIRKLEHAVHCAQLGIQNVKKAISKEKDMRKAADKKIEAAHPADRPAMVDAEQARRAEAREQLVQKDEATYSQLTYCEQQLAQARAALE